MSRISSAVPTKNLPQLTRFLRLTQVKKSEFSDDLLFKHGFQLSPFSCGFAFFHSLSTPLFDLWDKLVDCVVFSSHLGILNGLKFFYCYIWNSGG